jgi:hypothetical protein
MCRGVILNAPRYLSKSSGGFRQGAEASEKNKKSLLFLDKIFPIGDSI